MGTPPKVGSKVEFSRGMFGPWVGTVRRIYAARASHRAGIFGYRGQLMAEVSYTRANGTRGTRRCLVESLKPAPPQPVAGEPGAFLDPSSGERLLEVSPGEGLFVDPRGGFVRF